MMVLIIMLMLAMKLLHVDRAVKEVGGDVSMMVRAHNMEGWQVKNQ